VNGRGDLSSLRYKSSRARQSQPRPRPTLRDRDDGHGGRPTLSGGTPVTVRFPRAGTVLWTWAAGSEPL